MHNLREKIAYLQGLTKGLDIDDLTKEGKVLSGIIEVLGEVADQLEDIEVAHEDLEEYVESIDEDLFDLEGDIFGNDEIEMNDLVEVECPKCHEAVCFEAELMEDDDLIEVTCPNCDEVVYVNDDETFSDLHEDDLQGNEDL